MSDFEDELTIENEESEYNIQNRIQEGVMEKYPYLDNKDLVPISKERHEKIQTLLEDLQDQLKPTLLNIKKHQNLMEIQDRLSRKINNGISTFQTCMESARDMTDSDYCSDQFAQFLQFDALKYSLNVIKEY